MEENHELELSEEAKQQMNSFLQDMEELQRNNPEAFHELLNSLSLENKKSNSDETGGEGSINHQNIINAISQMREQKSGISGLELPGGKGTLSSDGIKSKVRYHQRCIPHFLKAERNKYNSRTWIYN